jgi:ergothioneine biosynthesis protein EgtB
LDRLVEARRNTDQLFELVEPRAFYERPIPERHRIVFYLGHLEAFDCNLLRGHCFGFEPFNPIFDKLFAFGIDPVGGSLPTDQASDWPQLPEIRQYNHRVRHELDTVLSKTTFPDESCNERSEPLETLLNVAIEHRLMHAETFAYMLHQLPLQSKRAPEQASAPFAPPVKHRTVIIPAGEAVLGLPRDRPRIFGWDNEFERHEIHVPAFEIDVFGVTNGDFLAFVLEGGYLERCLWTDRDWEWITSRGVTHPQFWVQRDDSWHYRTMFAEILLPADWPVYVSHAEASAYARWVGKALPTEAQWHRAAYGTPHGLDGRYPWGDQAPGERFGNFDFRHWDPAPVDAYPEGHSAFGVAGLLGNGWEWTSTVFGPLPGFRPFRFYPGYSANFFDEKHYVLKGGSSRTAACMLRRSFRNWFQPHYPYVYATFRCVSN